MADKEPAKMTEAAAAADTPATIAPAADEAERLKQFRQLGQAVVDYLSNYESPVNRLQSAIVRLTASLTDLLDRVTHSAELLQLWDLFKTTDYQKIDEIPLGAIEVDDLVSIADILTNLTPIMPDILAEVKELQKQPGMENLTFVDFVRIEDDDGNPIESHLMRIIRQIKEKQARAEAARIEKDIPKIEQFATKYIISPNNRLANELTRGLINSGAVDLVTANRDKKNEVTSYTLVTLTDTAEENITFRGNPYTAYDRAVHDAVVSIYDACTKKDITPVVTPIMIYKAMTGNADSSDRPSKQRLASITRSLQKMQRIYVEVDATDEVKALHIKDNSGNPIQSYKIGEYLLNMRLHTVKAGGKIVEGYQILTPPVLLTYSKISNQLLTGRASLLNIKDSDGATIDSTEGRIAIKTYLWRRIAIMRHDEEQAAEARRKHEAKLKTDSSLQSYPIEHFYKQSRTINFETLYKETDTPTTDRKSIMRYREYVFDVLAYWKGERLIRDYTTQTHGRAITGVTIIL